MGDIDTYSLIDFMPMVPEVYLRLFVRQNQQMWPFQVLTMLLGAAAIVLAWRGRSRAVGAILGAAAAWVGYSFFLELYSPINWAAEYIGWVFVAQGVVIALESATGRFEFADEQARGAGQKLGLGLAAFGLVGYPWLIPLSGRSWEGIELFGAAPDPTAVVMLGLVLAARRVPYELALVPVLWCAYAGATSYAMDWPVGLVTPTFAAVFVVAAVWRGLASSDGE